jgi:shikimate kinase/3-dehydroquinate synthase
MIERVVLIGFSGTGKSTTGQLIARDMGWSFLEMDSEIERREAMTIPEIFERHGEAYFRRVEASLLSEAIATERVIVSTGGGAVCTEEAWQTLRSRPGTLIVGFDAPPEELLRRLKRHSEENTSGETTRRPMLDSDDPLGRISQLLGQREQYYRRADVTIPVGRRSPDRTAADVCEMVLLANGEPSRVTLKAVSSESHVVIAPGVRASFQEAVSGAFPKASRLWVGADAKVVQAHAEWIESLSGGRAYTVNVHAIPSGESSKSIAGVSDLYDWMIGGGVERNDVAIALGGGVTGDLMGFVAATTLRGIGLVQVPTTLLSMVDSSVGGKTGINHAAGKNLIGAFYQPPLVMVDSAFLTTLPERELRSGFAEIIKHGVIQASVPGQEAGFLYEILEQNVGALLRLEEPLTSWVIRQNIALKAAVVEADEKEASLRQILNFGHTIGHGIEAAGYQLLHGEAIAVGMAAAMTIAVEQGRVGARERDRLVALLEAFGLPTTARFDPAIVRERMGSDKKKSSGVQRWVMPASGGGVEISTDVTNEQIDRALMAVLAGGRMS